MMEAFTGQTLDQDGVDLAHAVKRETEGNPFFTTELLRHLGETGLDPPRRHGALGGERRPV